VASALYERLPRGPHGLDRGAVLRNQRERIQGALAETIAGHGWERTNVTNVVRVAGVSRRAFYEQFANREHCLLATSEQITELCLASASAAVDASSDPERRLRAIADAVAEAVAGAPAAAALAVCHTEAAGREGVTCARRSAGTWERLLAHSLWPDGARRAPTAPMVRALVGGGLAIIRAHLLEDADGARSERAGSLRSELVSWAAPLGRALDEELARQIAFASARSLRERTRPSGGRTDGAAPARARVERSVLRLAVVAEFATVTAAQIADEAGVTTDAFFAEFSDPAACYAAAQDRVGTELLAALDRHPARGAWASAARARIGLLLCHLRERALSAHTLAHGACGVGSVAVRRNHELAAAVAERVLDGAPRAHPATRTATAGALWHTIGCQVAAGGVQLLPALRDHLAYVVIAAASDADTAARVVTDRA
jgi:AcrR family transcriptional regulator